MSYAMPALAMGVEEEQALSPALQQVLTRVRLRARRRAMWLRKLWHEEGESGGRLAVTHAELDTVLDDRDAPASEAAWYASEANLGILNHELAKVEAAIASDTDSRFALLHQVFSLRAQDSDLFQACLALSLDPSLARVYAYLQDHARRGYVTEDLVARLFGHGRCCRQGYESPLRRWQLIIEREVAPSEPPLLACDRMVRDWLLGEETLDEHLIGKAYTYPPRVPLDGWPVKEIAHFLSNTGNGAQVNRSRIRIAGPPGSGRRTLAACISAERGLPLLAIDADQIEDQAWPRVFIRAQRQAYLGRCALAWYGEKALRRPWPQVVPPFPVQFLICEPDESSSPVPNVVDHRVMMPSSLLDERRALWQRVVPNSQTWPAQAFEALVRRHRVTIGEVTAVARKQVRGPEQAATMIREAQRHRLGKLAQLLECSFTWDDLVVSDDLRTALEDLLFEAKERVAFWERPAARRLFPQGRGLVGLFSGKPGTGKTMAAQVIAASLGLDLFRIDLSSVVSKYVGETSQNLERVFSRAEHMDIVLLFDEADALFGKRTEIKDAHDRFANTDTNYLLQAIENYGGVALLSTNKKSNLDPAFIRRLRYVLDFPKPDFAQRLRIWHQVLAELTGSETVQALSKGLEALAAGVEATGAQIKFATLTALFAARRDGKPLGLKHLLRGLDRELTKEGRSMNERERMQLFNALN